MDIKDIKEIRFTFEDCESTTIPIKCFKTLKYTIHKNYITYFNADIINNADISADILYECTFEGNNVTPIQRIAAYNDITNIHFIKIDNAVEQYHVIYHDNKYNENESDYQYTKLVNYNEVILNIKRNNLTYCFNELFTFPTGTRFKSSRNIVYTIQKDKLGKYLSSGNCNDIRIHKSMINDTYIKLDKNKR